MQQILFVSMLEHGVNELMREQHWKEACSLLLKLDIHDWNLAPVHLRPRASLQESPAQIPGSIRIPAQLLG